MRRTGPGWSSCSSPYGGTDRMALLAALAAVVERLARTRRRVLVAVDGPDAAGKTTLADSLAEGLRVPAVRAGVDGFHRPRSVRYGRGTDSPEGYYRDSFDHQALAGKLLRPFATGVPGVRTACFDHVTDEAVGRDAAVPEVAVLVVDGVFLLRPELRQWWHLAVYRAEAEPLSYADVVVDNTDPAAPVVLRWDPPDGGQERRATQTR